MGTGQKVVRGVIYNATGNIFVQLFGITTAIIIARTLGPELQGTYVLILSIPITLNMFITLGWNQGLNRYIPALRSENREGLITPILRRVFGIRIILSVLVVMFLFIFSDLIGNIFNIEGWLDWQVLTLISVYLVLTNITSIISIVLTVNYQQKWHNLIDVLSASVMLLGILGLVYYDVMSVKNILALTLVPQLLSLICLSVAYKKSSVSPRNHNPDELTEYVKRFARYSAIMYFIQLAGFVLAYRSDIYFLAFYLGTASVSFYSIANGLVEQGTGIIGSRATGSMLVGAMTEKYKQEGIAALNNIFSYSIQFRFLYSVPIIFGGIFLSGDIILALYGADFMPVVHLMMAVFLTRFFIGFGGSYSGVLVALEKPHYFLWTKIISLANIPLNILLIPRIGVMGAVIATAISVLATMSVEIFLTLRIISLEFPFKNGFKMLLCGGIMLTGVFLFRELVNVDNLGLKLALEILLGAVIYGFAVLNLNPLDEEIWDFLPEKLVHVLDKMRFVKRIT